MIWDNEDVRIIEKYVREIYNDTDEYLKLMEVQMENSKKQSLIERYGKVNVIIALLCVIFLIINSVIVSELALNQLASNKYLAYVLNFLAGCEGKLGTIGSMSNAKDLVMESGGDYFYICICMQVYYICFLIFSHYCLRGRLLRRK